MSIKKVITNKGLELLASSSEATGQSYWIGYYSLAYVPSDKKETEDVVTQNMTQLTTSGDVIWNVFQGDLVGSGYYDGISDGSVGGNLFGLSMYNVNIKKHFRYVLDENGNNTLLSWQLDDINSSSPLMKEYVKFLGTDGTLASEIPIPASLYYLGDVTGGLSNSAFINKYSDSRLNGAEVYQTAEYSVDASNTVIVPLVSNDPRYYLDSNGTETAPTTPGTYFYDDEISPSTTTDVTTWFEPSNLVEKYADKFYKLHSTSNYNRFHAPVGEVGNILNSQIRSRNLSKTTKFFPISNYSVLNSERGIAFNGETREVATGIKLSININLSPRNKTMGYLDGTYDETSDLTLQDNYFNVNNVDELFNTTHTSFKFNRIGFYAIPMRKAPYTTQVDSIAGEPVDVQFEINPDAEPVLFGVVDWDQTVYMSDTGDGLSNFACDFNVNLESPNGVDDTSIVRDTAIFYNLYKDSSTTWYENQLIANAQTSNAITEIGLEVAAIKNKVTDACCPTTQIGNSESTSTGNGLRNLKDSDSASRGGLKGVDTYTEGSLLDGRTYILGLDSVTLGKNTAVDGDYSAILSGEDNSIYPSAKYVIDNTKVVHSIIGGGVGNIIKQSSSFIGSGIGNVIGEQAATSAIISGYNNKIQNDEVGGGATESVIIGGSQNEVNSTQSIIGSGYQNKIHNNSTYSSIMGGNINNIYSSHSSIINGYSNNIHGNSVNSIIGSGSGNSISTVLAVTSGMSSTGSSIFSGHNNHVNAIMSTIIGGESNKIELIEVPIGTGTQEDLLFGAIVGGQNNSIRKTIAKTSSPMCFIGGGRQNTILDTGEGCSILGGQDNTITIGGVTTDNVDDFTDFEIGLRSPTSSVITGGASNTITSAFSAFIGAGMSNQVSGYFTPAPDYTTHYASPFSAIVSGEINKIIGSNGSTIINGQNNKIQKTDVVKDNTAYGTILNGVNNEINDGIYNIIGSGQNNYIRDSAFSTITNGDTAQITDSPFSSITNGYESSIIGGEYNTINGKSNNIVDSTYSNIVGRANEITDTDNSALFGDNCKIDGNPGFATNTNYIFGGYNSNIIDSNYVSLIGGSINEINGGSYSTILGGINNRIDTSDNSNIIGGVNNLIENSSHGIIVGGNGGRARNYGEVTHSSGYFSQYDDALNGVEYGSCQNSVFLYRNDASDYVQVDIPATTNNYIELYLDGDSELVTIDNNMAMCGTITLSAIIPKCSDPGGFITSGVFVQHSMISFQATSGYNSPIEIVQSTVIS